MYLVYLANMASNTYLQYSLSWVWENVFQPSIKISASISGFRFSKNYMIKPTHFYSQTTDSQERKSQLKKKEQQIRTNSSFSSPQM